MRALRRTTRATATLTAAGVLALAAGPAMAADTTIVAQSEGEAISLSIAGNSVTDPLGGPFRAERTESGETTTGSNEPQASAITRQTAIDFGLLAQDAQTGLAGDKGVSEACAGIAGDGASFVGVGEDGSCLTPGDSGAFLKLGKLNLRQLSKVELIGGTGSSLQDLINALPPGPLRQALRDGLTQLNGAIRDSLRDLGNPGLTLSFDAIRSQCEAGPGETASGSAELTNVTAALQFPTGAPLDRLTLFGPLRTKPDPNTAITTDFDKVVDEIVRAIGDSIDDRQFGGQLGQALDQIRRELRDNLTSAIADQLGPLDDVITGTLNKQTRAPGEIEVTAIDAAILPAVAEQTGFNVVDLAFARSQCGPGAELPPGTIDDPDDPGSPDVPRFVPAGAEGALGGTAAGGTDLVPAAVALLALTTLATATGLTVQRRRVRAGD